MQKKQNSMPTYNILLHPGYNRVYYDQSLVMSMAELKLAFKRFEGTSDNLKLSTLAGINYLSFQYNKHLSDEEINLISQLSFVYAIFELLERGGELVLVPIAKNQALFVHSKISSLLKYSGKTNEIFTKMMINVALLSSDFSFQDQIQFLDPIAGKGTSLFEGCTYGFDVSGIEIESKSVHESSIFFKKFLEQEKYKHQYQKRSYGGKKQADGAVMHEFEYSLRKDEFKTETARKKLNLVLGNSVEANRFFKKNSFHLMVGDLPYGIAHGNQAKNKQSNITRNPLELLKAAMPAWYDVLKKGGVLVLAWNKFVLPKEAIVDVLKDNGFQVLADEPYNDFEHKVDMSIKRDIVVAKKAGLIA